MDIDLAKKFRNLLIGIGLSITAVVTIGGVMATIHHADVATHKQLPGVTADFLAKCAGQPYTNASAGENIGMCGTRISGFIAGHDFAMEQMQVPDGDVRHLWCVPSNTDEATYVNTVRSWAELNPDKYNHVVETMKSSNDATIATAVIIAAFHSTYPCTK